MHIPRNTPIPSPNWQQYADHNSTGQLLSSVQEFLDERRFPVGELALQQFLNMEMALNDLLSFMQSPTTTGTTGDANPTAETYQQQLQQQSLITSIEQSLLLFRRLVQEHESNPQLMEEEEMQHWCQGRYSRSTKLLDDILTQWSHWWLHHQNRSTKTNKNDHHDGDTNNYQHQYTPTEMLALVENLRSGTPPLQLTERTFRILMRAATATRDHQPENLADWADQLLNQMLEESMDNLLMRPSLPTLNVILGAWAKSGRPDAIQRVEKLIQTMQELHKDGVLESHPDKVSYFILMQAWSKSGRKEAPFKVEEVLNVMKSLPVEHNAAPGTEAYRTAIHAWVNSTEPDSTLRAYSLFVEIIRSFLQSRDDETLMIDADLCSIMISKLAKERHCDKAIEIYDLLQELRNCKGVELFEHTPQILSGMIIAFSKSKGDGNAAQAESLLLRLEEMATTRSDTRIMPKRGYFVDVIMALLGSRLDGRVDRAEQLLLKMLDHHRAGVPNMVPDKGLFDQVLMGWTGVKRDDAGERAERLVKIMNNATTEFKSMRSKPNELSYFYVLNAWSRSGRLDAAERAEMVFYELQDRFNRGDLSMKPGIKHFTTLVSSWARCAHPDAPQRAQSIFDAVLDLHKAGDASLRPDKKLYTSLMRAWSRVGAVKFVESLFMEMFNNDHLKPSTMTFNIMLEAWLISGHPEARSKASFLFDSMLDFTEDNTLDVPPDGFTYCLMIEIMTKGEYSDGPDQAETYLKMLKASTIMSDRRGYEKIFSCYVAAIASLCRKNDSAAVARADALIDELLSLCQSRRIPAPRRDEYVKFLAVVGESGVQGKAEIARKLLKSPREVNFSPFFTQ